MPPELNVECTSGVTVGPLETMVPVLKMLPGHEVTCYCGVVVCPVETTL